MLLIQQDLIAITCLYLYLGPSFTYQCFPPALELEILKIQGLIPYP